MNQSEPEDSVISVNEEAPPALFVSVRRVLE